MRICIVGASGKLGQYMVEHALDRSYEVVGVCREQSVGKLDDFKGRISVVPGPTNDPEVIKGRSQGATGCSSCSSHEASTATRPSGGKCGERHCEPTGDERPDPEDPPHDAQDRVHASSLRGRFAATDGSVLRELRRASRDGLVKKHPADQQPLRGGRSLGTLVRSTNSLAKALKRWMSAKFDASPSEARTAPPEGSPIAST